MFTGIIEDIGLVRSVSASELSVQTKLDSIASGDSIALNGVCLTASAIYRQGKNSVVAFDYTPETSSRSTLSGLKKGSFVNLERALKAGARLGGHMVTGHIEGVAGITKISSQGNSIIFTLKIEHDLTKYIVPKGSICVEGISLTIASCSGDEFSVSVIPFTHKNTTLKFRQPGEKVNIETDIIAKYIEKSMLFKEKGGLTLEFLKDNGF